MKYEVTLREVEVYIVEGVEADTEEQAIKKAWGVLSEHGKDRRAEYHNDSETGDCYAYEQED